MDAEFRPEADDQPTDPIGPPVLPKMPRYLVRSLALSGVAVGAPLVALILETATGTPTTRC
jgi:hypothetical protein